VELAAGARVGPYEVVSLLGAGGMGEVYRARDHRLGREVALKVLPSSVASDADRLWRFELEAKAVAALNHPNILAVFDIGKDDGRSYLASELLEGESLRTRLAGMALPVRKALDYAIQIAQGLAAAHDKGIVHRDLKPENLFVTRDGRVKILDFGLAKLMPSEGSQVASQDLTRSQSEGTTPGTLMGTVGYMSPEQVRLLPADARSDIFSFGAILYEMLSGQRAFRGETPTDTMHAILRADPPDLSLSQSHSPAVARIVRHCLEKSPDERFQSARDLAFDLQAITETSGAGPPSAPWKSRRFGLRSFLAAGLLLGVSATSLLVGRMTSRTPPPSYQRMTFRSGLLFSARFGADGRTVVYSAAWQGRPQELFVTEAGSPESRPLGLRDARLLALSSTNEMALLLKPQLTGWFVHRGTLARAPLAGGVPRELLEDVEDADWSADGKALAIVHWVDDGWRLEFPIGHVLYAPKAPGWLSDIRVSPRGDQIAFLEHPQEGDMQGSVALVDRSGARRTLATGLVHVSGTAWSASGDEVLFTGNHDRSTLNYLSAVSLSGSERVLARAPGSFVLMDMTSGGRGLLRTNIASTPILFLGPGDRRERDLSELDLSFVVDLSRDGRTLLGVEQGAGVGPHWAIFLRPTDGSPAVWLGEGDPLALSPDGKWVLTRRFYLSPQRLVLVPTGAGQSHELEPGPVERYLQGKWFPDGKRILFSAIEPGDKARLYVQDLDGGKPRAVGPEGLTLSPLGGAVSPDGTRTIALDPDLGPALYTIGATEVTPLPGLGPGDQAIGWSDDGRGILFYRPAAPAVAVFRLDIASGRTSVVRELLPSSPDGRFGHYRILATPDGRSFAYNYLRQANDLYLGDGL
jgi:serine/threonine protein kinase